MDYTTMSRVDLATACAQRGLAAYGNKATLAARLADADAPDVPLAVGESPAVSLSEGSGTPPAPTPPAPEPTVFRREFTLTGGFDDATHTALLAETAVQATAAGLRVRGGTRLAARTAHADGSYTLTYETHVRRESP